MIEIEEQYDIELQNTEETPIKIIISMLVICMVLLCSGCRLSFKCSFRAQCCQKYALFQRKLQMKVV